jgi:hypothetical protein
LRNFQLIARGVDVGPLGHALVLKPELWNANRLRTTFEGSPHAQADDIWLWFNEEGTEDEVIDGKDVRPYPAWLELPQARHIVFDLMRRVEGVRLGRVLITRLSAGKTITPHADEGAPAEYYDRYQVALQSLAGCMFNIDEESVEFEMGEIWWIDNRKSHSVENVSSDDRIVMIVDIKSAQ